MVFHEILSCTDYILLYMPQQAKFTCGAVCEVHDKSFVLSMRRNCTQFKIGHPQEKLHVAQKFIFVFISLLWRNAMRRNCTKLNMY